MTDTPSTPKTPSIPTAFSVETDVIDIPEEEIQMHSATSTQRKQTKIHVQKNTHSTQRKGEDPDTCSDIQDEAFQLIQKIHNQLQQVQWDLQRLHSLHKYKN